MAFEYTFSRAYRAKINRLKIFAHKIPIENPRILEIGGGGSGLTSKVFEELPFKEIISSDIEDFNGVGVGNTNLEMICDARNLAAFNDNRFDLITMFDVLEHIEEDSLAINEAKRVLAPGGHVYVQTPNCPWGYPYFKKLGFLFKDPKKLMGLWGHKREGYCLDNLNKTFKGFSLSEFEYSFSNRDSLIYDVNHLKAPLFIRNYLADILTILPEHCIKEEGREIIALFKNEE